ncbi:uncharacterized protein LOC143888644 [Tasmannia lanceolata]|uniref:uncharacterized protein LOC143888644 n=1 Tax=Tasmannia lanceolata TaxID=3420 RepID=UPI00406281B1
MNQDNTLDRGVASRVRRVETVSVFSITVDKAGAGGRAALVLIRKPPGTGSCADLRRAQPTETDLLSHTIKVLTNQPLRQVLHRPDSSGRLVKWAVELNEFDIQYLPRPTIKAQVLADFVAECTIHQQNIESEVARTPLVENATTIGERTEAETKPVITEDIPVPAEQNPSSNEPLWEVYVDGSSNKLVVNQIQGVYEAHDERMIKYLSKVRQLADKFKNFEVIRIPRTENAKADVLSKLAASGYTTLRSICMEFLKKSRIENEAVEVMQVEHEPCWMDEIIDYLRSGKLPEAKKEARKVIQRAARFSLDGESLYKRSYTIPYLKCLRPSNAAYTLQETHEGICREHLGGKALAIKGIKKRLDEKAGRWADKLYHVLWAYRTTPRTATGESPFNLSFGTKVVIPIDVGVPSPRITNFNEQTNGDGLRANLDLLEEAREESRIRVAAYNQKVSRYHDLKIRPREFRAGDLVLRKTDISQPKKVSKLSPTWEGPFRVKEIIRPGSYRLETLGEHQLPHAWNSKNLRKYYQ